MKQEAQSSTRSALAVECVLWDFGDTLATWKGGSEEWTAAYEALHRQKGFASAWNLGRVEPDEVIAHLSVSLKMPASDVRTHLMRTDLFEFFPFTHSFFRAQHLPQSIVTVNPALFRAMAPELGLTEAVDTIVISGEEGTTDKGVLCEIALRRMGDGFARDRVLLIDDKQTNLDAWAARGGAGYLFTGDARFERDVSNGIDGLLAHSV